MTEFISIPGIYLMGMTPDPRNNISKYQTKTSKSLWVFKNWSIPCTIEMPVQRGSSLTGQGESGWLGWRWMGDGVKCVRPHPSWLAWREEYYEGKCDCAGSSPASPICLHINYQLGPPLWKNMTEYKVNLGHPWKPLPPAERRKC